MSHFRIYHNPRCRKSRETLQILEEQGTDPEIVLYLQDSPSGSDLKSLGELMNKKPMEFIRKGEQEFKDHVKGKDLSDDELYELMAQYPILIERPIVVKDDQAAVLGRPPAEVLSLVAGG